MDKFSTQTFIRGALSASLVLTLFGCPSESKPKDGPPIGSGTVSAAVTTLEARSNSAISGSATFDQVDGKVKIVVDVAGATPGQHGLHLHQNGDCSDPAGKSAGDHFNPGKMDHGSPDKAPHHAGDLGNITVGEDGKGHLEIESDGLSVSAGANAVIGRAIILHEKPDDLQTQPTGNSGARIGCGVILPKKT